MKLFRIVFSVLALLLTGCKEEAKPIPDYKDWIQQDDDDDIVMVPDGDLYDFEKGRTGLVAPSDLVLIYGGSHHRDPIDIPEYVLSDYVEYTDKNGESHWLFDGFLFLEFMYVGQGATDRTFVTGYSYNGAYLPAATKSEWEILADYYFKDGYALDALEASIKSHAAALGNPPSKRKVIIGIPEPITYEYPATSSGSTTYWGTLNGRAMDFSSNSDRVTACKWYIDRVRANFAAKGYEYLDLVGFYWVAEKATQTTAVMPEVAKYLNGMYYSFNWIPYYNSDGSTRWKTFGFNYAYLQPNYFFNTSIAYSRLVDACSVASTYNMGLEMEFDGNAMAVNGNAYRLRNYMDAFRTYGAWEKKLLAYYQGSWALRWLKHSSDTQNTDLYHEFCEFVVTRPTREAE